ncbi:MAG: hypothetical protein V4864_07110 [Pseudomonadota bacterium]
MTNHRPHHWIAVALVILLALLVLRDVHGQAATGSAAMFEGRPALAGAQAGLGAQAGPPQGGLGVQGSDAAQLSLRPPAALRADADMPRGTPAGDVVASNAAAERDMVRKDRDRVATENRSALRKTQRALKRTVQRTRHGVAPVDAS